jgi:hypothetical protein
MCNVKLIDDYIDLDLIQPLYIDEDGKHVYLYLDQNELSKESIFTFRQKNAAKHLEDQALQTKPII